MCCRHSLAGSKQGKSRGCSRSGSKQQRRQERHFLVPTSAQESSSPVQGPAVQLPARGDFPRQTASCALHHHIPARVARCPQTPFPTPYVPLLYYLPSISFLFTLHHLPFLYTFLHVLLHDPCKKYLKSLIS